MSRTRFVAFVERRRDKVAAHEFLATATAARHVFIAAAEREGRFG
jgi:hypothetical protein